MLPRVAVLEMSLDRGGGRVQLAHPADSAGLEVEVVHQPPVVRCRPHGPAVGTRGVQPRDRGTLLAGAEGCGQKDVVVPDDRRAPAETGNIGPPDDVVGLTPGLGQSGIVGDRPGVWTAEQGPLALLRRHRPRPSQQQHRDHADRCATHGPPPSTAPLFSHARTVRHRRVVQESGEALRLLLPPASYLLSSAFCLLRAISIHSAPRSARCRCRTGR